MKNLILVFMIPVFIVGCTRCDKQKDAVIKINNYEISKAEFEQEFKDSSFASDDTPQSRKDFLDNLVDRILILQDAQKNNLDNDPRFLKMVEKFWMQSLLRLALEKKSKDIAVASLVSDKDIEESYQGMLKDGKTTKSYKEIYQQIKRDITKLKESQIMSEWLTQLHKNADIQVNKDLIPKNK
jgi:hypothetical protein